MRILIIFTIIIAVGSMIYKWRYKLANILMAIGFINKLAVAIGMKVPVIRSKIIPNIFRKSI